MNLNPFDWRGPEFLVFYFVLGVAVNLVYRWFLRLRENQARLDCRRLDLVNDPYQIAYLRGGTPEALRVVLVALIDRGLLKAADASVIPGRPDAEKWVKRPLEKAVVQFFGTKSRGMADMFKDSGLRAQADAYATALTRDDFLVHATVTMNRLLLALPMLAILDGTAVAKIVLALSRGKHNILFLVILAVVFTFVLLRAVVKRRTAAGDQVMRQLKDNFGQMKTRATGLRPGGATNEVAMTAAVFGLTVLPAASFPYVRQLFPKADTVGSSGSGCSGSGCAGSSGSSCGGSSCGGGGCGGGCGGCGG